MICATQDCTNKGSFQVRVDLGREMGEFVVLDDRERIQDLEVCDECYGMLYGPPYPGEFSLGTCQLPVDLIS